MKITNFQELSNEKKSKMEERLAELKLEEIQSKWYLIFGKQKIIMGSKS